MVARSGSNITPILGLMAACARPPATPQVTAPGPDAGGAQVAVDGGPGPLPVESVRAVWDGGAADIQAPDASVSPFAAIEVRTGAALDDYRVRLLDDDDRMQANHAVVERGDGGLTIDITPTRPLPAARCCRLVVDGELGGLSEGPGPRFYRPLIARFRPWPLPAPPASKASRRRRRRHRRFR